MRKIKKGTKEQSYFCVTEDDFQDVYDHAGRTPALPFEVVSSTW